MKKITINKKTLLSLLKKHKHITPKISKVEPFYTAVTFSIHNQILSITSNNGEAKLEIERFLQDVKKETSFFFSVNYADLMLYLKAISYIDMQIERKGNDVIFSDVKTASKARFPIEGIEHSWEEKHTLEPIEKVSFSLDKDRIADLVKISETSNDTTGVKLVAQSVFVYPDSFVSIYDNFMFSSCKIEESINTQPFSIYGRYLKIIEGLENCDIGFSETEIQIKSDGFTLLMPMKDLKAAEKESTFKTVFGFEKFGTVEIEKAELFSINKYKKLIEYDSYSAFKFQIKDGDFIGSSTDKITTAIEHDFEAMSVTGEGIARVNIMFLQQVAKVIDNKPLSFSFVMQPLSNGLSRNVIIEQGNYAYCIACLSD